MRTSKLDQAYDAVKDDECLQKQATTSKIKVGIDYRDYEETIKMKLQLQYGKDPRVLRFGE